MYNRLDPIYEAKDAYLSVMNEATDDKGIKRLVDELLPPILTDEEIHDYLYKKEKGIKDKSMKRIDELLDIFPNLKPHFEIIEKHHKIIMKVMIQRATQDLIDSEVKDEIKETILKTAPKSFYNDEKFKRAAEIYRSSKK